MIFIEGKLSPHEGGVEVISRLRKIATICGALVCASLLGLILGMTQAETRGAGYATQLPALKIAIARASLIAQTFFQFFQLLGFKGPWATTLSLGLGIFLNNALVASIIAFFPPLILKAKPFSDKYLARIYYERGIWLFKPIGWKPYKILSMTLPIYGLALQCYLIGGIALMSGMRFSGAEFLPFETASITALCIFAVAPALSENPDQNLSRYFNILKKLLPLIFLTLFAAAVLEAHSLIIMQHLP